MAIRRVAVIGAGIGGLITGAVLARRGYDVTIIERQGHPGGRLGSEHEAGLTVDFAPYFFPRGGEGPLGRAALEAGGSLPFRKVRSLTVFDGERRTELPIDVRSTLAQAAVMLRMRLNPLRAVGHRAFLNAVSRGDPELVRRHDVTPLSDFLDGYTDDRDLHRLVNALCLMLFMLPYNIVSTGEFIESLSGMIRTGHAGYPEGGVGRIPGFFREAFERAGGRLLTGMEATAILHRQGKVTGVETDHEEMPFDAVVSNAGIARTIQLAGFDRAGERFAETYGAYIPSRGMVCLRYCIEGRYVPDGVIVGIPGLATPRLLNKIYTDTYAEPSDVPFVATVPSNLDSTLAPRGSQVLVAGAVVSSSRVKRRKSEGVIELLRARLNSLFPDLLRRTRWVRPVTIDDVMSASGHPLADVSGVAQTVDQVGVNGVPVRTPLTGLYLVGSDAGARGTGAEKAAASALEAVRFFPPLG